MNSAPCVGLLGCGHIAHALATGWTRADLPAAERPRMAGFDIRPEAAEHLHAACDVAACASPAELAARSDLLVVAVRPAEVQAALTGLATELRDVPVISLAAGVPLSELTSWLPTGAKVGRVIPNVAVSHGCGLLVWAGGTLGTAEDELRRLWSFLGEVIEVPEHLFDEATVVASCGPGFAALFVEAFEEAGVAVGLDWQTAAQLAVGAVAGTVELVRRSGETGGVRRAVSTPGGMTIAGIEQLELAGLRPALMAAVRAAVARARRQG